MVGTLHAGVSADHDTMCFAGLLTQQLQMRYLCTLILNLQPLLLKLSKLQFVLAADLVLLSMQHLSAHSCLCEYSKMLKDL